jgi:hypothetical protein
MGRMKAPSKAWRVTLLLELDHGLSSDDLRQIAAHTSGRAVIRRGSKESELAPEVSVTAIATAIGSDDALDNIVRGMEHRVASLPGDNRVVRVNHYLVAA